MTYTKEGKILELANISLSFDGKLILRDINLTVDDIVSTTATIGQVTTLLGRSGSGKSTLFRIIAGLIPPDTGMVTIEGFPVKAGVVGMVLQSYPLLQHRTVYHNMTLVCDEVDRVEQFLAEFDIWEQRDKYPKQLSGGQRQRAAIVQQLLCSDHLTLLDEPFSGLDPVATDKLCKVINKVVNLHTRNTVIISSHILEPAIAISDSIWVLGKEKDKGGATIVRTEDLAAQGLAWDPNIRERHEFTRKIEEMRQLFHTI